MVGQLAAGRGKARYRMERRTFLLNSTRMLWAALFAGRMPAAAELFLPPPPNTPRMALIIDDIGFNLRRAERFLHPGIPITFSILPHLRWSEESALALHAGGHEIMLHQPMEPFSPAVDPGPGAIFVNDRSDRIHRVVNENILTLPNVIGMNNHMGSRYTQISRKMDQALSAVKSRGLFFVDSLTTGHSTAFVRARQMGVAALRRDLFLDNQHHAAAVLHQLSRLARRAQQRGTAVGIGHPRPETAEGILRFLDTPEARGLDFVHISRLL